MSTTTTKSTKYTIADAKNFVVQLDLEIKHAKFSLFSYDKDKKTLTDIPHPTFEFIGDINGPIMPHIVMNKAYDVGPRYPCVKFGVRETDELYNIISLYYRAVHVSYFAAILTRWMSTTKFTWVPGFKFHGFYVDGSDEDGINVRAISNEGLVDNLFEKVQYSTSDKIHTEEKFRSALRKAFNCDVRTSNQIILPLERPIFYESKKGKAVGSKTIYLEPKLLHKNFPNGRNKYRAINEKETEEMLKASNWGIMIPMLTSAVVGGEKRYFQPGQTMNWVDFPSSGFKEVTAAGEANYFVGKVLFNCKGTTHFDIPVAMTDSIVLKFNMSWSCNVFKLPETSSFNRSYAPSSGFESMDIDEDKILAMHSSSVQAPMKEVNAENSPLQDESSAQPSRMSKAAALGLKKKSVDGAAAAKSGVEDDE